MSKPMTGAAAGDRRQQFLSAVKNQKLDTVRWSLTHGGQSVSTRDEDGYTAIQLAASSNKPKVLQLLLDICRRSRELELIDLRDGAGDDMTALMLAAAAGHEACVKELLYAGANAKLKCDAGLTAEEWARKEGHTALADLIARGGEDESDDEADGDVSDDADPEETSTQRSRRKRRELAAQESRGAKPSAKDAEEEEEVGEARAGGAAGGAGEAVPAADAAPTWPEVAKALTSGQKELILTDRLVGDVDGGSGGVDPALWRCTGLNLLNMSLKSESGERPLRSLSEGIARLAGMRTLILSNNALETLPDGISALTGLKALEVAFNKLASLPASFSKLTTLETLLLAHNQLTSVASLAGCTNLVSVTLDSNQLSQLDDAAFECKPRLALLSARNNVMTRLPPELGECGLLQSVFVRGNALHDVPFELSALKKLKDLELDDNPLDDPKIKKMIKNPAGLIKEIVPYLKKRGKTAASQPLARTSPAAAAAAASAPKAPAAAATPAPAPPPAPAAAPSRGDDDDDDDGKKLSKKDRAKLERKALEEKQKAAALALAQKAAEAEASRATGGGDDGDDGGEAGDSDDEDEAELVRRRKGAGSFLYALDPSERERLEKEETERLRKAAEEKAAREAAARAQEEEADAAEAEKRLKALALKEAKSEGIAWVFTAGVIQKVPASTLPAGSVARVKAAAGGGGGSETFYELVCELPGIMCGRIIGKGGATIKEVTQRSGARISIDNAAPGMAHLQVAGRPEALESARMLINNALASKR